MSDTTEPTEPTQPTEPLNPSVEETAATIPLDSVTAHGAEAPADATAPDRVLPRPRIRWAGITWGAIFSSIGVTTLVIIGTPNRRADFGSWATSLNPGGAALVGILLLGFLILILGLTSVLRRAQRR